MSNTEFPGWHGTTIIGVRKGNQVVVAGDGQVSLGPTVIKGTARKVRRLSPGGNDVVVGFAGSTADAFTLLERLEAKLEATPGQLARASVELAKDWRTDKYLQKLEAMLIVTDGEELLIITGAGDVLEPEHGVAAIGSGGNFALAAARGLQETEMDAESIARDASKLMKDVKVTFEKMDKALESIKKVGDSMNITMSKVNDEFLSKKNLDNFSTSLANFEEASADIKDASAELKPTITDARESLAEFKKAAVGTQDLLADARTEIAHIGPALRDIPKAVKSIDRAATKAEETMAALQDKDGLVGTMAYDKQTGTNAKEFMKNLKRYGILRYRDDKAKEENDPRNKFRGSRR